MPAAAVRCLAKLNLDLRVLHRRADGYHELRTVFQTISLGDELTLEVTPAPATAIALDSDIDIADNLVVRAAKLVLDAAAATAHVRLRLVKRIPMGGGLGGGSTDAAAVLLALPVLAGQWLPFATLLDLAARVGSDVPFFLLGGTALGVGRGEEVYPLADLPALAALVVAPAGVHVATGPAYAALGRGLTNAQQSFSMSSFQGFVLSLGQGPGAAGVVGENEFEAVVFRQHPRLKSIQTTLLEHGALAARMTGSGAAVYGLFESRTAAERAGGAFPLDRVEVVEFVTGAHYRAEWRHWLQEHTVGEQWPPQSRYGR